MYTPKSNPSFQKFLDIEKRRAEGRSTVADSRPGDLLASMYGQLFGLSKTRTKNTKKDREA